MDRHPIRASQHIGVRRRVVEILGRRGLHAGHAEERLKKIISKELSVDEADVVPDASFIDDLNADSLDLVELIMALEEEFSIKISDEEADKIKTVRDAMEFVQEHGGD